MCSKQMFLVSSLWLSLFLFASCDDSPGVGADGGDGDATVDLTLDVPDTSPDSGDVATLSCADPISVSSAGDVRDALADLEFGYLGPYTSGSPPITVDLEVVGSLQLDVDDFDTPSDCLERTDCRDTLMFRIEPGVDGVATGTTDDEISWMNGYSSVLLTDTVFRISPLMIDTHPGLYNFVPVLTIMPRCDSACGENQLMCEVDHVCYSTLGSEYCRLCEGQDKQTCACWTPDGDLADDAECSFMVSGDVMCMGHCDSGVCLSDDPGWAGCP